MPPFDPETIPDELHAIHERLDNGEARFNRLERAVEENTRITKESSEVINDVRDLLVFARVGTKLIRWLGALGALAVAALTVWTSVKK